MAGRVYSTHFFSARIANATQAGAVGYTVPTGKLAIVRSIDVFVDAVGALLVGRYTAAGSIPFVSSNGVPFLGVAHWEGRQVFPAGGIIVCEYVSGAHRVSVSGYLLDAP